MVTCKKCKKQGVGETINFKSRMANYRSCIKNKKVSCNIDKHFIEEDNHSLEDFDVQIIVQLENVPCNNDQARKRRKQFEGYWQITLCTLAPFQSTNWKQILNGMIKISFILCKINN